MLLRIGLAVVFLYAAYGAFMQPDVWIGYLPGFIATSSSATIILQIFSVIEIVLSIWLLIGKKTFYAAVIAAVMLVGIISSNLSELDVIFRDFGLLFAALALAALSFD